MHDEQDAVVIHVLQGEHSEVHRNRSIGKFRLDLEPGGGERSRIVVRFDLTLDGTLKVTATQAATGRSKELAIDNALSQFQADERVRAQARLGAMFDASAELLEDHDLPTQEQWGGDESDSRQPASGSEAGDAAEKFPAATELLKQAREIKASVTAEDARDIQSLTENLKQAMEADDSSAVASLSEELDDILFYVR
jgi:molecular chaperone DnaK (HSP70)